MEIMRPDYVYTIEELKTLVETISSGGYVND